MEKVEGRGGYRPGSGRPTTDRKVLLAVRISQRAMDLLNACTNNKSAYIDGLIKKDNEPTTQKQ